MPTHRRGLNLQGASAASSARLFFALWPDAAVRQQLSKHAQAFARYAKPTPNASLHLTLTFLGDVPLHRIDAVCAAAARVTSAAFLLCLDRLGGWQRQGIAWLAPSQPPVELAELSAGLRGALNGARVSLDAKPFHAHVTIARKLKRPLPATAIEPIVWRVDSFTLMRSRLEPGAAHYEEVGRWPLRCGA